MPLTVSHAAVAIPLRRLRLPTSALIIGSMTPDFEFFLRLSDQRVGAHSPAGLLLFCVPVGFVTLLLYHRLLKQPLIALLPRAHQRKLVRPSRGFRFFPAGQLMRIIVALFLGAGSHLLWDGWGHHDGVFVQLFPVLRRGVALGTALTMNLYDLIQHGSSVMGIVVLALAYRRWYRRALRAPAASLGPVEHPLPRGAVAAAIAGVSGLAGITHALVRTSPGQTVAFIAQSAVSGVSAFFVSWCVYSLHWRWWRRRAEGDSTG